MTSTPTNTFKCTRTFSAHQRVPRQAAGRSTAWLNMQKAIVEEHNRDRAADRLQAEAFQCTGLGMTTEQRQFAAMSILEEARRHQCQQQVPTPPGTPLKNRSPLGFKARRKRPQFSLRGEKEYDTVRMDIAILMSKKNTAAQSAGLNTAVDVDGMGRFAGQQDIPADFYDHTMTQLSLLNLWGR